MANNLFADVPAAAVARQTISFASAGFDTTNTRIIYEVGSPLKSYVPGRAINAVTGFTTGNGYYIVPKLDMDKSAYLIPPIPEGGSEPPPGGTTIEDVAYTYYTPSVDVYNDLAGTPATGGGPVGELRDQMHLVYTHPNQWDLAQATSGNRPTLISSGINGKPSIETNYTGGAAKYLPTGTFSPVLVPVFEKWIVFQLKEAQTNKYITLGNLQLDLAIDGSGFLSVYCGGAGFVPTSHTVAVDTPIIIRAIFRDGTVDVYVNGVSVGTALVAGDNDAQSGYNMGAPDATCVHGWFRQFITIDHELTSGEAADILTILKTDNGIA